MTINELTLRPVIIQVKYTGSWQHWEELESFHNYQEAIKRLRCFNFNLDLDLRQIKFSNGRIIKIRFYDAISQKVITPESQWAVGLNEVMT